MPDTRSVARLDENAAATAIVLTADELAGIDTLPATRPVAGERYPAIGLATLNG